MCNLTFQRDSNIARTVLSSFMGEFKNDPNINKEYFERLNKSLTSIINHCHCNPFIVGFIFDIAYCYPQQINLDPVRVTEGKFLFFSIITLLTCYF